MSLTNNHDEQQEHRIFSSVAELVIADQALDISEFREKYLQLEHRLAESEAVAAAYRELAQAGIHDGHRLTKQLRSAQAQVERLRAERDQTLAARSGNQPSIAA